jgi:hypothetical protein
MAYMAQGFVEVLLAQPGRRIADYAIKINGTTGSVAELVRSLWGHGLVLPDSNVISAETRVHIDE